MHEEQHAAAVKDSLRLKSEVTASIFDDKVKEMGTMTVSLGTITVKLNYVPEMITDSDTAEFLSRAVAIAIREAYSTYPEVFEPFYEPRLCT